MREIVCAMVLLNKLWALDTLEKFNFLVKMIAVDLTNMANISS